MAESCTSVRFAHFRCTTIFLPRDAMLRGTSHGHVSVRPSVRLSVRPSVRHKSEFY